MIDIIICCNVGYSLFDFLSFEHHDIQELNRIFFNGVGILSCWYIRSSSD